MLKNIITTAFEVVTAEADPLNPRAVIGAGMSFVQLMRTLWNYNEERAAEFKQYTAEAALRAKEANNEWKFQEQAFWEVVKAYRDRGCEKTHMPLAPSDFNQPPEYRF